MSFLSRAIERIRPRFNREPIDTIIARPPTPIRREPLPIVPPALRGPVPLPIVPPKISEKRLDISRITGGLPNKKPTPIISNPIGLAPILEDAIGKESGAPNVFRPKLGGSDFLPRQEVVPIPPSIGGIGGINQDLRPLERPIIPPKRDDFMSIDRIVNFDDLKLGQIKARPDDFMPRGPVLPITNPAPTPPGGVTFGTLGGQGYGRFPLGTAGPEYLYDDDGNPIMEPQFKTRIDPNIGITPRPDPIITDPVIEPAPTTPDAVAPDATQTEPMQPINVSNQDPFAASVTQQQVGLDPLTEQLLFGIGGQGGFIPGAMRAAEKVFFDEEGNPVVIDEQVAGFSPDQLQAMQMQRKALGIQNPFLQGAGQAFGAGTQALEEGLQRGRTAAIGALEATRGGVGSLQTGLGESADILRGTLGGYDPSMTQQFYDPFEDRVVQQTIEDIMEQGARSDIGARASDIARGGESAFGSRARLGASERQEALGRGLAEALSGIRSRGFQQAQQTGLGEFARQKAAERAASSGLASLAGQGFGGSQALAGALSGLGQTEQDIGQQRFSGQFGLGTSLQGLGAQAAGASASDIAALYGMGSQQQQQTQQMLDAQRRNLQQRQMTPLLQYQALAPFVSMAPAGQFQTTTQFAPRPSAMQTGIGTGLAAFGALGNLYGGN